MEQTQTLALIKPHAVSAGWVPEIIDRYRESGLRVTGCYTLRLSRDQVVKFYAEHEGKDFFPELIDAMCENETVALILEAPNAVQLVRELNGATKPDEALPGTIRHDFRGPGGPRNTVHGSDSAAAAVREIDLIFREKV